MPADFAYCKTSSGLLYVSVNVTGPPKISSLTSVATTDSLTINWKTDVPSNASIVTDPYAPGPYNEPGPSDPAPKTDHSFTISNLESNRNVFFQVTSCNEAGCTPQAGYIKTLVQTADQPSPSPGPQGEIRDIELVSLNLPIPPQVAQGTTAQISVDLRNRGTVSLTPIVKIDATDKFGKIFTIGSKTTTLNAGASGSVTISWSTVGIEEGDYEIKATAVVVNESITSNNFGSAVLIITASANPPKILAPPTVTATTSTAVIKWETDVDSKSRVYYGIGRVGAPSKDDTLTKTHLIILRGLKPATSYVYKVESCVCLQSCVSSACSSFPEGDDTRSFQTASDPVGACKPYNYCSAANTTYVTYAEVNGSCIAQGSGIKCDTLVSGCFKPSCNPAVGGCTGVPDNSQCKDVCGKQTLSVTGACRESDADALRGGCSFTELPCSELNLCNAQPFACGGKSYYCVKNGNAYEWSEDSGNCKVLPGEGEKPKYSISKGEPGKEPEKVNASEIRTGVGSEANPLLRNATSGRRNAINALAIATEPELIREGDFVKVGVVTDSGSRITAIVCASPGEPAQCYCEAGYKGSENNFRCDVLNAVSGNYIVTMLNAEKEAGSIAVILESGKKASVAKILVPDRQNEEIFIAALIGSAVLILFAAGSILSKYQQARGLGKKLMREKEKIAKARDELKYKYMKRILSDREFNAAYMALDKREAEADARLKEWAEKHGPKTSREKRTEAEGQTAAAAQSHAEEAKGAGPSKKEAPSDEIEKLIRELGG